MSQETTTQTKEIIEKNDGLMNRVHEHLDHKLHHITAGRSNPSLLEDVRAEAYGSQSPLNQIASISTPDARTLIIQPWDKTLLPSIEKSILAANLGVTPSNDGARVIINIPIPSEERRKELIKTVHKDAEHARVSLRNLRHHGMSEIKAAGLSEDMQKDVEHELDQLTSNWNKKIDELVQAKEVEIMTI